jgi:hypothetical protein
MHAVLNINHFLYRTLATTRQRASRPFSRTRWVVTSANPLRNEGKHLVRCCREEVKSIIDLFGGKDPSSREMVGNESRLLRRRRGLEARRAEADYWRKRCRLV